MVRQRSSGSGRCPGRGRRYDDGERERVVAEARGLRGAGTPWRRVVAATGVSEPTLRQWLAGREQVPAAQGGSGVARSPLPVVVREEGRPAERGLTVVSPSGFRLEGLGLVEAVQVLRALS